MDTDTRLPVCYRHPDRETRLACARCDRPACYDCLRAADVGHHCPECAGPPPQRVAEADVATPVTFGLLGLTVAVFLLQSVFPDVLPLLAQQNLFIVVQGEWWRILSAALLHSGLTHILFNMWALYLFGPELERRLGSLPFLGLYLASAAAGGAAYYLFGALREPAVGASGAIFGLFGAWLVTAFRSRHTMAGRANLRSLLVLLAINLALPLVPGLNIAWQAHVGGLAAGAVLAGVWALPPAAGPVARLVPALVVLAGAVAVVTLLPPRPPVY